VPGFQPSGATVATLMGDQPRSPRREQGGREQGGREQRSREQGSRGEARRPPADPIFSKPYEPAAAAAAKPEAPQPERKRRQPQVAALLGGLKRA
jgi:hypothetical protein